MKNVTKLLQVLTLVILWGGFTYQVTAQNMPSRTATNNSTVAEATDMTPPGAASATMYTPPVTDVPASVLYDNGPVFNSTGTGAGGANESILSLPLNIFGFGHQYALGYSVADDFTVPGGSTWAIGSIEFFAYQTGSSTTPTINGLAMQIWNGKPGDFGSAVVWGDFVTNVMASASFSNIYRVQAPNGGVLRPIMKVVANTPGLSLPAGTYWVEWAMAGTLSSGPWAPPIVTGTLATGNAIQSLDEGATYNDILSGTYPQGLPFIINGEVVTTPIPTLGEWGLILLGLALLGFGTFYILRLRQT